MNIKIAPSILSADFARMGEEVESLEAAGADMIHCDVMDGSFVPNITFGIKMIEDIRKRTKLPLDVHLMIVDPQNLIPEFIKAGADIVTFHMEATKYPIDTLNLIHVLGKKAGVVINPATPVDVLKEALPYCDMVLLMSVNPGFGGQSFMEPVKEKIQAVRAMIDASGKKIDLEIDGGINFDNIEQVRALGANVIVAGNTVFKSENRQAAIERLRGSKCARC